MTTAFQRTGFQNNAFQITKPRSMRVVGGDVEPFYYDWWRKRHHDEKPPEIPPPEFVEELADLAEAQEPFTPSPRRIPKKAIQSLAPAQLQMFSTLQRERAIAEFQRLAMEMDEEDAIAVLLAAMM